MHGGECGKHVRLDDLELLVQLRAEGTIKRLGIVVPGGERKGGNPPEEVGRSVERRELVPCGFQLHVTPDLQKHVGQHSVVHGQF